MLAYVLLDYENSHCLFDLFTTVEVLTLSRVCSTWMSAILEPHHWKKRFRSHQKEHYRTFYKAEPELHDYVGWRFMCIQKASHFAEGYSLRIPDLVNISVPEKCFQNKEIVIELRAVMNEWLHQMTVAIEDQQAIEMISVDTVPSRAPLAEAEYWSHKHDAIENLWEQLQNPFIDDAKRILEMAEAPKKKMALFTKLRGDVRESLPKNETLLLR